MPVSSRPFRLQARALAVLTLFLPLVTVYQVRAEDQPADPLAAQTPQGMVYVPGGPFTMGTNQKDNPEAKVKIHAYDDARPQHEMTLPPFYIDKTEVTNAEYKRYCDATGYPPPPHWPNGTYPEGEGDVPVTHVNWWEAGAYAAWASKRLPTEAEWEKAARGTDGRQYPWGNEWSVNNLVWNQKKPQAVGSKPSGASPYGALDMAGNVFEWVAGWYQAYPGSTLNLPEFGTSFKVCRGGGFDGFEFIARTLYRSIARPQTRSEWLGFRCVKDAK